ncbi:MAG: Crp/Fnr family transcriptional regulator [Marinilabiliaceae bacterium]|nr:Crp/Fnr family transcriptional regulator [Marinilabiliaceae bacterium]
MDYINLNSVNCKECKKGSKCFQYLYSDEIEFINQKKTQVYYRQGETIFKQGAFAPYVLYMIEGLAKIYIQNANKQINLNIVKPGEFIAFSSIFGETVFRYSISALSDSLICMIDKEAMKNLLQKNTDFAMRITSRNYHNESHYLDIIKTVTFKQMRGKLASALLYLSNEEFKKVNLFSFLNRQDIADFASISLESAVKFIKEFEADELLTIKGKTITIINKERLMEISIKG